MGKEEYGKGLGGYTRSLNIFFGVVGASREAIDFVLNECRFAP
jgi:hypothetical protein